MARKDYNIHSIPTKEVYYTELSTLDSFCNIKRNCNKTGRWRTTMGSVQRFSNGRKISDGSELSPDVVKELREAFSLFDRDGDGTITTDELGVVMENLGIKTNQQDLHEMIQEVDEDGSGAVDFNEFCMLMQRKIAQETQQEVLELFNIWDESGEGIMEADELRCLLNRIPERLTRKEIDLLVSQADTKKNGKINFEEFVKTLSRTSEP
ncbi:hypothetical protein ABFA07_008393 [Porites harrisoni]